MGLQSGQWQLQAGQRELIGRGCGQRLAQSFQCKAKAYGGDNRCGKMRGRMAQAGLVASKPDGLDGVAKAVVDCLAHRNHRQRYCLCPVIISGAPIARSIFFEARMQADSNPLGQRSEYPAQVNAAILCPVERAAARGALGVAANALPFVGSDIWNAWELSWLDTRGQPCIAVAELRVPCTSPRLVESKSLKLYLNGYAMTRFGTSQEIQTRVATDVSHCVGATITLQLHQVSALATLGGQALAGQSLDTQKLTFEVGSYAAPRPDVLAVDRDAQEVDETLVTERFRSLCPITGQPDWAAIQIRYRGAPVNRAGLLRYLVSFREHGDFHEACVERIFMDIRAHCHPRELMVHARFLRRGGIDINPWRATAGFGLEPENSRTLRQ